MVLINARKIRKKCKKHGLSMLYAPQTDVNEGYGTIFVLRNAAVVIDSFIHYSHLIKAKTLQIIWNVVIL